MMRIKVFLFIILLLNVNAYAQDHLAIGARAHYGFIIPHTASIEPLSHTKPYGFEISISRLHTSYNSWNIFRRYNISGLQAGFFNFQNPATVGSAYTVTLFTEPVFRTGKDFYFSVRAGAGMSWQTRIWHYELNPANRFFSTRVSMPLYLSARFNYRITGNAFLTLAGTYNHISNGAVKVPNMGINFPTLSAGFEYYPHSFPELAGFKPEKRARMNKRYIQFQVIGGFKYVWEQPCWAYGASVRHVWQIRDFYALNAGGEVIVDGGVKKYLEIHEIEEDHKRAAITIGQDFFLGRIYFTQYFGIYVYSPYKAKNAVYQKYELSYKISPAFFAGVYLKAHASEADLLGLSLNFLLKLTGCIVLADSLPSNG
ncbi:MAG TPA: acyloxyacyl hydrolase [Bacteroidales bacterium]|nr:acyloxyacyl hydrolase [Bacteroidales bacterium]